MLNIGLLRSGILRSECVVTKQTQVYICTLEKFILVNVITLLYMDEVVWNGNYTGLYKLGMVNSKFHFIRSFCEMLICISTYFEGNPCQRKNSN